MGAGTAYCRACGVVVSVDHELHPDLGQLIDPWGEPVVVGRGSDRCDFTAPNRLPCTSPKDGHPGRHYTSDGRSWDLSAWDLEVPR